MKLGKLLLTAAAASLLSGLLYASTFVVDISHSSIGFKIKHLMISNVRGDFSTFEGKYELEKGTLTALEGTIKAASIDTGIEKRDNHLRSPDFLNVKKYPVITFKMTSYKEGELTGDLTMHGVTKSVTLDTEVSHTVKDPWGNIRSSVSMEGKINRTDFGLSWNKLLEAGGLTVGEKVKLYIELEGIEQK